MSTFRLEVVTQERLVVSTEVEHVVLPGQGGKFGILKDHVPIMAALEIGILEFGPRGGRPRKIALGGGFAEMHANKLTVMANTAELAEEIDVLRARRAKERAEKRLAERREDLDFTRARIALQKAIMRIEAADGEFRQDPP
ncbi:MAG TPA: F0F1 ATP synthase subunit epsilon [Firmicutes bacterium]|nr:F0F1 ATP synthase subunit epsilon [Bacillota bacterium]